MATAESGSRATFFAARARLSQPSSVPFTPGVPDSRKSWASKCERVPSGEPAAWMNAKRPSLYKGRSAASLGCSPNVPSRSQGRTRTRSLPWRSRMPVEARALRYDRVLERRPPRSARPSAPLLELHDERLLGARRTRRARGARPAEQADERRPRSRPGGGTRGGTGGALSSSLIVLSKSSAPSTSDGETGRRGSFDAPCRPDRAFEISGSSRRLSRSLHRRVRDDWPPRIGRRSDAGRESAAVGAVRRPARRVGRRRRSGRVGAVVEQALGMAFRRAIERAGVHPRLGLGPASRVGGSLAPVQRHSQAAHGLRDPGSGSPDLGAPVARRALTTNSRGVLTFDRKKRFCQNSGDENSAR